MTLIKKTRAWAVVCVILDAYAYTRTRIKIKKRSPKYAYSVRSSASAGPVGNTISRGDLCVRRTRRGKKCVSLHCKNIFSRHISARLHNSHARDLSSFSFFFFFFFARVLILYIFAHTSANFSRYEDDDEDTCVYVCVCEYLRAPSAGRAISRHHNGDLLARVPG